MLFLFNVYGICEALYITAVSHPEGKFKGTYRGKYNIIENLGVIAFGRDLVTLDAILLNVTNRPVLEGTERLIEMAQEEFGVLDRGAVKEAKIKVGNWLSPSNI